MTAPTRTISFKITFVGEGFVGKTSIIKKFTKNTFNDKYIKTIGANFVKHEVNYNSDKLKLILWDIAGQDLFGFLKPAFLRGSKLSIVVYSLEKNDLGKNSMERISDWIQDIKTYCGDIPIWVFANKSDLVNSEEINENFLQSLLDRNLIQEFHITSAKTGAGVQEAFSSLIESLYSSYFNS